MRHIFKYLIRKLLQKQGRRWFNKNEGNQRMNNEEKKAFITALACETVEEGRSLLKEAKTDEQRQLAAELIRSGGAIIMDVYRPLDDPR